MPVATVSRVYADVCTERGPSYYDYESFAPTWNTPDPYELIKKVGRGKYSDVFLAFNSLSGALCVIKVLKPVKKAKIRREISILQHLCGGPNVLALLDTVRDPVTKIPSLVTEAVDARDFRVLYGQFTLRDVQYYMLQLLHAIDHCHRNGIMHRDIKPHNVVIDHSARTLRLIDFGLAEYYLPGTAYNVRVASRHYKAPELLVDLRTYDYSLDIWSFGCTLAAAVFRFGESFIRGDSNRDQLVKTVDLLGSQAFAEYTEKYQIELTPAVADLCAGRPARPLSSLVTSENAHLATPAAIALIERCLKFDHMERCTAQEAMADPFFDDVRAQVAADVARQVEAAEAQFAALAQEAGI